MTRDPSDAKPPRDYQQHLEVETPENVVLDYEVAGIGSRTLAAFIDVLILAAWFLATFLVVELLGLGNAWGSWIRAIMFLIMALSYWGYFTFFEALRAGQTPGKRFSGIRVVRDTGHPVTMGAAGARGLLRTIDLFPPLLLADLILMALQPRAKRLGDLVAGTIVVRDTPIESAMIEPASFMEEETGAPELEDAEFRILREYMERAGGFTPELRARFAERLSERFAERFPSRSPNPVVFLAQLYQSELSRRRSRFAVTRGGGSGIGERFIARKNNRWEEFRAQADRASRQGLDSLAPEELPVFAARYREVAADLARARTYKAPAATRHQLERLVAAGHNALYRDERKTAARLWEIIMRECPAAVLEARRYVLLATIAFAIPGMAGYLLLRDRPELAQEVLPDGMLRRAEAGAERMAQGKGYYIARPEEQPGAATFIIGNNVRVAFFCFAGGALLGVGSLVLLAFNGLSLGTTFGHFANLGLFGYIGTFVVGHGILEMFAICVSGAAGFLLGMSMIAPGNLRRSEALVVNGRVAIRMIGAVVVMLTLAGTIEGLVSTGTEGLPYRLALSAASLAALTLYLFNGATYLRAAAAQRAGAGPASTTPA
ncbi:MAG: stage II sporulation protein M [Gemmatimonadota bacterium]